MQTRIARLKEMAVRNKKDLVIAKQVNNSLSSFLLHRQQSSKWPVKCPVQRFGTLQCQVRALEFQAETERILVLIMAVFQPKAKPPFPFF